MKWVPRFKIRSLLILVACVAMMIETKMLWSRSWQHHTKAMFHVSQERQHKLNAAKWIKGADRTVKRVDADVAKAIKAVKAANAKIKENEAYAQANANSKIETKYANELREVYRFLLELEELNLKHCQSSQAFETESVASYRGYAENETRHATYHAALARKYRHAASRPWFGVATDPPMPPTTP